MFCVAFYCLDEVWDEVVSAFELNVDVGPSFFTSDAFSDQAVVDCDDVDEDCSGYYGWED